MPVGTLLDLVRGAPAEPESVLAFGLVAGLLAPVLAAPMSLLFRQCRPDRDKRLRALRSAMAEIRVQQRRLQVRRLQLVMPDPYGSRNDTGWRKEKAYFCKNRILPRLAKAGLADQWPCIAQEVDRRIERTAVHSRPPRFGPGMDPGEYERHCALLLRRAGWRAEVSQAGADQGTDVLARRGRRCLVLQCKLHSRPVGNSAVQQIAAARAHHRADFAAVVSNADFTVHARQLAASNGVYLLHHEQLRGFRNF